MRAGRFNVSKFRVSAAIRVGGRAGRPPNEKINEWIQPVDAVFLAHLLHVNEVAPYAPL